MIETGPSAAHGSFDDAHGDTWSVRCGECLLDVPFSEPVAILLSSTAGHAIQYFHPELREVNTRRWPGCFASKVRRTVARRCSRGSTAGARAANGTDRLVCACSGVGPAVVARAIFFHSQIFYYVMTC